MRKCFISILLLVNIGVSAQIVRIEGNQLKTDSAGLHALVNFNVETVRNTQQFFRLGAGSQVKYKKNKNTFLSLNEIRLVIANSSQFENRGFQHFRYQRFLDSTFTAEFFTQVQFDRLLNIRIRQLNGVGPRFTLKYDSTQQSFFGLAYMFEYEEEQSTGIINQDHRLSSYISYHKAGKKDSFLIVIYAQPRIVELSDIRVSGVASYSIQLKQNIRFNVRAEMLYDDEPVEGATNLTYTVLNGISWSLD